VLTPFSIGTSDGHTRSNNPGYHEISTQLAHDLDDFLEPPLSHHSI